MCFRSLTCLLVHLFVRLLARPLTHTFRHTSTHTHTRTHTQAKPIRMIRSSSSSRILTKTHAIWAPQPFIQTLCMCTKFCFARLYTERNVRSHVCVYDHIRIRFAHSPTYCYYYCYCNRNWYKYYLFLFQQDSSINTSFDSRHSVRAVDIIAVCENCVLCM